MENEILSDRKKSISLFLFISFLLVIIATGTYFLIKKIQTSKTEREKIFTQEIRPLVEKLDLQQGKDKVLGCIIYEKERKVLCLHPLMLTFEEIPFYSIYSVKEIQEISNGGFVVLHPTLDGLEKYNPNINEIFENWFEFINENEEDIFFEDIEGKTHVSINTYLAWKILEMYQKDKDQEDISKLIQKLQEGEYVSIFPVKDKYRKKLCLMEDIECQVLQRNMDVPFHLISDYQKLDYKELDIFSTQNLYKIYMLSLALQSLGTEEDSDYQKRFSAYSDFKNTLSDIYNLTEKEILFISNYLPSNLVQYWKELYEGWETDGLNDYSILIDIYCRNSDCIKDKINIMYDYYVD